MAKSIAYMRERGYSVLDNGNFYPQPTYGKVQLSPKLQEFLSRSTAMGRFFGGWPKQLGIWSGNVYAPLPLKTLHVSRETWPDPKAGYIPKYHVTQGYFGAIGLYPQCQTTDDGEIEAVVSVWDYTTFPDFPRLEAHYRALGAAIYRFCLDGKPVCEVTYARGINPSADVDFSPDFKIIKYRPSYSFRLWQASLAVGAVGLTGSAVGYLYGRSKPKTKRT